MSINLIETIKSSGMYRITYGDEKHEIIVFINGVSPFLKLENFVWCVDKHINRGVDYLRGLDVKKIEKL